jgi:hypothetical protein
MGVCFESIVKSDGKGSWCIELKDPVKEISFTCKNLEEYEEKIQELSEPYGGNIDEVKWLQESGLHPRLIDEVRFEMVKFQEKYKDQLTK